MSSSLAWLMPFVEEEKSITVGTWRAISAASCSGPEGSAWSVPETAWQARRAAAIRPPSNGIGSMRQSGSHSTLHFSAAAASSARVARLGQQGGQHAGVEVALVEQQRGLARRSP